MIPKRWQIVIIGCALLILAFVIYQFFLTKPYNYSSSEKSCSMVHFNDFEQWWEVKKDVYKKYNITKEQFKNFPSPNGFTFRWVITLPININNITVGDIIAFNEGHRIIQHRVIDKRESTRGNYYLATIGDNSDGQWTTEKSITKAEYIGKTYNIPFYPLVSKLVGYPTKCILPIHEESCMIQCLEMSFHNEKDCLKLNETQKKSCYKGLKDCDDVDVKYKDYCYLGAGECDLVTSTSIKDECLYEQGKCEEIGDTYSEERECTFRDQCFYDRVIEKNKYCDDAVLTWQEIHDCRNEFETYSVYCDEIEDDFKQFVCRRFYTFGVNLQ